MTTQTDQQRPLEFSIALRGYDRVQVDEYIDRLHGLLEEAEDRVRRAEAPQDSGQHAEVGPRITKIFELARAEAADLRDAARRDASETIRTAREQAEGLLLANQQEWDRLLDEYEAERERIRLEVRELAERKAAVLGDLHRLREALGLASAGLDDSRAVLSERPEAPEEPRAIEAADDDMTREIPARVAARRPEDVIEASLAEQDDLADEPATVPLRRVS